MTKLNSIYKNSIALMMSSTLLLACSSGSETGTGMVSLDVTDAPIDNAAKVVVQFSSVELQGEESKVITLDPPVQLDLLQLTGSNASSLLNNEILQAGNYQWIKLGVDTSGALDSYIEMDDGSVNELEIPSGSTSGLKLVRGFTVPVGGAVDFTIDFDLRKSIVLTQQDYKLKPALRMVDNTEVGHVSGNVSSTLLSDASCTSGNSVYVYAGLDVMPVDVSTASDAVLTTAGVEFVNDSYDYEVGFLTAGEYTVALTCQSADDDPEALDVIEFITQKNITVVADQTTTLDF